MTERPVSLLVVVPSPVAVTGFRRALWKFRNQLGVEGVPVSDLGEGLATRRFDAVLVDLRDPVATLLEARRVVPAATRVVLAGSPEDRLRLETIAHRVLVKPLAPRDLAHVVIEAARSPEIDDLESRVQDALGSLDELPSLSRTSRELDELLDRPSFDSRAIAAVVEADPAATARLLKLVNSAWFALRAPVVSIVRAIEMIGLDGVRAVAMLGSYGEADALMSRAGLDIDAMLEASMATACKAKRMAGPDDVEATFTAGLLHEIGQFALAQHDPDRYRKLWFSAPLITPDMEREHFGIDHAEAGAFVLRRWGLPPEIVDAVRYHHHREPLSCPVADVLRQAAAMPGFHDVSERREMLVSTAL